MVYKYQTRRKKPNKVLASAIGIGVFIIAIIIFFYGIIWFRGQGDAEDAEKVLTEISTVVDVVDPNREEAPRRRSREEVDLLSFRGGGDAIALVEHIESLISSGCPKDAIAQIDAVEEKLGHYGRQLLSKALFEAKEWDRIKEHLSCPQNSDELTKLVLANLALKYCAQAEHAISTADDTGGFPALLLQELRNRMLAEKEISQ